MKEVKILFIKFSTDEKDSRIISKVIAVPVESSREDVEKIILTKFYTVKNVEFIDYFSDAIIFEA